MTAKQAAKLIEKQALLAAEQRTILAARLYGQEVKQEIFAQIRSHPVSMELKTHTKNSAFLGRSGSLFGFLGFNDNSDPVEELIAFLDGFWTLEVKKEKLFFGTRITVKMGVPRPDDLKKAGLVLPWQPSIAWPYAIEKNISNLPFFLNVNKGRSGEGIQIKNATSNVNFNGTPYLSSILSDARGLLRKKKFKIV